MESYQKRKRLLEERYGKRIQVKSFNGEVSKKTQNNKYVEQIADITYTEGLNIAYGTKDGLYQHHNELFIAGTKDFPIDHIDVLKLQIDDILNKTKRGRDADAYYRSRHGIDTVIRRAFLGRSSCFKFRKQYQKEGDNPYGIIQSKTFGAPVVSGNLGSSFGKLGKTIVKDCIFDLSVAGGVAIGASADSAIGFSYGGLLIGLGADVGKKLQLIWVID